MMVVSLLRCNHFRAGLAGIVDGDRVHCHGISRDAQAWDSSSPPAIFFSEDKNVSQKKVETRPIGPSILEAAQMAIDASERHKPMPKKARGILRELILEATDLAGGGSGHGDDGIIRYLRRQANANPVAFLSLLKSVIPLQVQAHNRNELIVEIVKRDPITTIQNSAPKQLGAPLVSKSPVGLSDARRQEGSRNLAQTRRKG